MKVGLGVGGWGGVPGKGEDGPLEGPGNTQPGSATRPRESQTRAQNILFVTRPPPHPWCGSLQLLRWRFAELLGDFHVWGSVHSWPSGRGRPLAPRLSVAFAMLCAHACLAALVTAAGPEQVGGLSSQGVRTPGPQRGPLLTQELAGLAAWREVTAGGPCVLPAGTTGPGGVCGAAGSASAGRHCVGACARHHGVWLPGGSAAQTLSERVCFERLVSSSNFKKLSDQRNREQF